MTPRRLADRRHRRRQRALFWALAAALVSYGLLAGDHKPHHLAVLWREEQRSVERIQELEERNRELTATRARLAGDTLALEALAREKGMIRPGDVVYRIVPVSPGVREAAAESLVVRAAREAAARAADSLRLEALRAERARRLPAAPAEETEPSAEASDPRWEPLAVPQPAVADTSR